VIGRGGKFCIALQDIVLCAIDFFFEGVPCVAFCVAPVGCEFRRARRGLRFYLTLRVLTGTQLIRLVPDILSIISTKVPLRHTLYWKGKIVSPNERLVENRNSTFQHFNRRFSSEYNSN
jgi:hypothetical protein